MAAKESSVLALRDHLRSHVEAEAQILKEYVQATDGTASEALSYLVDLIMTDERRHHQIFMDLAETIQNEVDLVGAAAAIPALDFDRVDDPRTYEELERLLRFEMEDRRELKELYRRLRRLPNPSLYTLLVELMQRDTDKHIRILRFAKKHAKRRSISQHHH